MSNFLLNLYKIDKKAARILIVLIIIQLTISIVRVQLTPFFVYSMFSWKEPKRHSDTLGFTFVRIGNTTMPETGILKLRCNNDFLPDVVGHYFNYDKVISDSSINEKLKRRIPQAVSAKMPVFLKNMYRNHIPSLINDLNTSGNTTESAKRFPEWLRNYVQEKEGNYKDSVFIYKLVVRFGNGKFDTISEKRIL